MKKTILGLLISLTAGAAITSYYRIPYLNALIGVKGNTATKTLCFENGSGNSCFRYNSGNGKLEYAHDGSTWKRIGLASDLDSTGGTNGQVATANGSGATSWVTPVTAGADAVLTQTSNYTILSTDFSTSAHKLMLKANCSSSCTMILPAASNTGYDLTVTSVGAGAVTIQRASSDTINGATTLNIGASYGAARMIADGGTLWNQSTQLPSGLTLTAFTSNGTFTPTRTGQAIVCSCGGGGGGEGGSAGGGAGSAGSWGCVTVPVTNGTGLAVSLGSGGLGGAGASTPGADGGDTTLGTNLALWKGGKHGGGSTGGVAAGPFSGAGGSNADVGGSVTPAIGDGASTIYGQPGVSGLVLTCNSTQGGASGGGSPWGNGGGGSCGGTNPTNGTPYCAGGGGRGSFGGTGGGNGAPARMEIYL